ncbi:MAG TPA: hypothetical protein VHZ30_00695, partial [Verrucomicrobiae bacterium]|nr:hypothetical protein [Verrucomicrobiae bacterium]
MLFPPQREDYTVCGYRSISRAPRSQKIVLPEKSRLASDQEPAFRHFSMAKSVINSAAKQNNPQRS